MSKPMTVVDIRLQSTKLDHDPNTRAAANIRQQQIDHQVKEYLARGGKITKLPAYDELCNARPVAQCAHGAGVSVLG